MSLTTSSGASILTPTQVSELVVQPLIQASVAFQVSTVIQTSSHSLRVPILSDDVGSGWVAEGEEIDVDEPTLDEIEVTPAKLAALTVITSELANDSSPSAAKVVGDSIVRDLARKTDAAFFAAAAPTNGPAETLGTITSTPVDAGDAWSNLDWAEAAKSVAEQRNSMVTAFVCNPALALVLASLKEITGSNKPLLGADPTSPTSRVVAGVPLYVSPAVANNVVWAIPRQHALVVLREGTSLVSDSSVFFTSDRLAIRATTRLAFGFPYEGAIAKVTISP